MGEAQPSFGFVKELEKKKRLTIEEQIAALKAVEVIRDGSYIFAMLTKDEGPCVRRISPSFYTKIFAKRSVIDSRGRKEWLQYITWLHMCTVKGCCVHAYLRR